MCCGCSIRSTSATSFLAPHTEGEIVSCRETVVSPAWNCSFKGVGTLVSLLWNYSFIALELQFQAMKHFASPLIVKSIPYA